MHWINIHLKYLKKTIFNLIFICSACASCVTYNFQILASLQKTGRIKSKAAQITTKSINRKAKKRAWVQPLSGSLLLALPQCPSYLPGKSGKKGLVCKSTILKVSPSSWTPYMGWLQLWAGKKTEREAGQEESVGLVSSIPVLCPGPAPEEHPRHSWNMECSLQAPMLNTRATV